MFSVQFEYGVGVYRSFNPTLPRCGTSLPEPYRNSSLHHPMHHLLSSYEHPSTLSIPRFQSQFELRYKSIKPSTSLTQCFLQYKLLTHPYRNTQPKRLQFIPQPHVASIPNKTSQTTQTCQPKISPPTLHANQIVPA